MPLEADHTYEATVSAARMTESQGGTPGIWLSLETPDGSISHTIWLTQNTRDSAEKSLNALGVTSEILASDDFWEDPGFHLINAECSIVTKLDEYNGKERVIVQWINQRQRKASDTAKVRAASLFKRVPVGAGSESVMAEPEVPF